jgi:hypothetical protein
MSGRRKTPEKNPYLDESTLRSVRKSQVGLARISSRLFA